LKRNIVIFTIGGIGSGHFSQGVPVLMELVEHLKSKYHLTVYSLTAANTDFKPQGFRLRAVPLGYKTPLVLRALWLLWLFLKDYLFQKQRPELIHAFWGFPCGLLAAVCKRILGIRVVVHLQGGDSVGIPAIGYGIFQKPASLKAKLAKWAYQKANALVCLTNFQKKTLQQYHSPKVPLFVIPYGVDTSIFRPLETQRVISEPLQLIHVADLNPVKNQKMLLEAFQAILQVSPSTSLKIIGFDTLNEQIQALAQHLNIEKNISFLGMLPRKEIIQYLQKTHILLHTSFYEAQGVVIAEAMACETVVCGSKVGLVADLSPEYVLSVEVSDAQALAQQVIHLFQNPALYQNLQEKALYWTQNHSFAWTTSQISLLYEAILENSVSESKGKEIGLI